MTILKNNFVCRLGGSDASKRRVYYEWFPVRCNTNNKGFVQLGVLVLPMSFIGRKIKLKVEELEDEK